MKLWYQSLSHRADTNPYGAVLKQILAAVAWWTASTARTCWTSSRLRRRACSIVNGIVELVKMGETAAKLFRLTGRFISKRAAYAPLEGELLQRIRDFYGPQVYPQAK